MFANNRDFGKLFTVKHRLVWVEFDKQLKQLRELFQLRERKQIWLHAYAYQCYVSVIDCFVQEYVHNFLVKQLLWRIYNAFMQILYKNNN